MNISLPAPKPEMGVRGITGATIYFYDGKTQKQITQAEYDRQTLAGIAAALGAEAVIFTKPNPTVSRRRDAAGAAAELTAGAKDAEEEKESETPKAERKKMDSPPQHGLADYLEAAFAGGKKEKPAKKGKKKGERFSLEEALGK